jgi:hypothetical protein
MSNSKISALTSASTPLAGTEVLPIVQSSATTKVTIANITAGRSVSAADYVMSTGNLVPSTAAKGINFTANTPAAGMTSQLLNWYEEGTWTPTLSSSGTPPTVTSYTTRYGSYTRTGNRVFITCHVRATLSAIGTGTPTLTGLPFLAAGNCLNGPSFGIVSLLSPLGTTNYVSGTSVTFSGSIYSLSASAYLTFSLIYEV